MYTVKTTIYNLGGLYDQNSIHRMLLHRKFFVVSDYLLNVTSDHKILHTQSHLHVHVPGVWDHSRVHMYLVVGLCKFGTTFCVNFEPQRCAYSCMCVATVWKMASTSNSRRTKVLTLHGHVLATVVSKTTGCLELVFAASRGGLK